MKSFLLLLPLILHVIGRADSKSDISGPTVGMLKRAYCGCVCCEDDESKCHRHSSIEEDYHCISTHCTEDFCEKWKKAKCTTSCFCAKCKDRLPPTSQRCYYHVGLIPGCQCGDHQDIKCEDESLEETEAVGGPMGQLRKMKEQRHCIVSCLCKECSDRLPSQLQNDCKLAKDPSDCDCKGTQCPTDEDIRMLNKLHKENSSLSEAAKKLLREQPGDEDLASLNEKLKPAIDAGQAEPLSPETWKQTKCNAQCVCEKCQFNKPEMETNCKVVLRKWDPSCPPCGDEVVCPEFDGAGACKLYCFCSKCKNHKSMSAGMRMKCDGIMAATDEICPCDELVDCSVLGQVSKLTKPKAEKEPSMTSQDGKPRPGKLKPKKKLWDEL